MKRILDWWDQHKPVLGRIWFEARIPLLVATIWAAITYSRGVNFYAVFAALSVAFFFCFFLQGQVLRIAKNVRDEMDTDEFRESFASIQEAIETIKKQGIASTQPPSRLPTLGIPVYEGKEKNLFLQARKAIDDGNFYPGILAGAVGFELSAREIGKRLDVAPRIPLGRLIHEFQTQIPEYSERIQNALRLRNSLVHGTIRDVSGDQAIVMLVQLSLAVDLINAATSRRSIP